METKVDVIVFKRRGRVYKTSDDLYIPRNTVEWDECAVSTQSGDFLWNFAKRGAKGDKTRDEISSLSLSFSFFFLFSLSRGRKTWKRNGGKRLGISFNRIVFLDTWTVARMDFQIYALERWWDSCGASKYGRF